MVSGFQNAPKKPGLAVSTPIPDFYLVDEKHFTLLGHECQT